MGSEMCIRDRPSVEQDEADIVLDSADEPEEVSGISKSVSVDKQRLNYDKRGAALQSWPFYFYVASVSLVQSKKVVAGSATAFRFHASHPCAAEVSQQLLTSRPWYVPELIGPSIPAVDDDPEKRAMLLLILFKPWNPDLASLLEDFPTWGAALQAFESQLHAEAQDFLTDRPALFSPAYWAARSLRVMLHISNCSGKPAPVRGIRTNPDAALGSTAGRTLEPEDCGGASSDDEDACSEQSERMPDDDDLDAAVYQAEQDSQSSRAQSKFLPTLHFIETIVQGRSTLEFSVDNDAFVQDFRAIPQETDVAPEPGSLSAGPEWRLPAHLRLQELLTKETDW